MGKERAEPVETPGDSTVPLSSFWKTNSFEELANEQGVYPLSDLSIITGGWPENEDIDSFLETIRSSRTN